jgi:hypothetical protein
VISRQENNLQTVHNDRNEAALPEENNEEEMPLQEGLAREQQCSCKEGQVPKSQLLNHWDLYLQKKKNTCKKKTIGTRTKFGTSQV